MAKLSQIRALLQRASQASAGELRFRAGQEFHKRSDGLLYRLGWLGTPSGEAEHGRRSSSGGSFFFSAADLPLLAEIAQTRFPEECRATIQRADRTAAHRFDLLGYENLDLGDEIDWHSDPVHGKRSPEKLWYRIPYLDFDTVGDSKIVWELNRHQHFVTLGRAYQLTRDETYAREFVSQVRHWRKKNPYPVGINWTSSLEVAFRSLSWLWARELFADSPLVSDEFRSELVAGLCQNARYIERNLSVYFSANTHLLGEGVALFFVGVLCPELRAASRWRERGWSIILDAARQQVRPDGGYFEQSTYYHVYALDFFVHSRILGARNRVQIPAEFDKTIIRMLEYLAALGTAGPPARFGDDDGGRVFDPSRTRAEHLLDPLSTGAVLFRRPDFRAVAGSLREETLWLLGPESAGDFDRLPKVSPPSVSHAFPDTGTYILASKGLSLAFDAGPLGSGRGGHGHADALSLCLCADGALLLGDPGTGTYTGSKEIRDDFRSTRAHSTLSLDGLDQAEVVNPFAWDRFPQVTVERWLDGETFSLIEASHDGYLRFAQPVRHRRLVYFAKGRFFLVIDSAEGAGEHRLEINWRLPAAPPDLDESHRSVAKSGSAGLALIPTEDSGWTAELAAGRWSDSYGSESSRPLLRCRAKANLPAEYATLLVPRVTQRTALGVLQRRTGNRAGVRGFEYVVGGERHLWVLADSQEWQLGEFRSDANFAYCAQDAGGRIANLVLCGASFFTVAGANFLHADSRQAQLEYRLIDGGAEVFPAHVAQASSAALPADELAAASAAAPHTPDGAS